MIFTRSAGAVMIFTRSRNAAASDNSMYCMIPDPFPSSAFGKGSATPDYPPPYGASPASVWLGGAKVAYSYRPIMPETVRLGEGNPLV